MTDQDMEIQETRRNLAQKELELKAQSRELSSTQEALFWTRQKLQEVQAENRKLLIMMTELEASKA
jgi:hypothetical protein